MTQCCRVPFRLIGLSLLCASLAVLGRALWADSGPTPQDARVVKTVAEFMQEGHVSRYKIDDEISRRMFRTFLMERFRGLDPTKVYFTAADVAEFRRHETTLDDEVLKGDVSFAYKVLERFRQRMKERMALVEEFVNAEHDFTVDEYISTDYDSIDFAHTPEETRERWRKKIKFDLLQQRLEKKPLPEAAQKEKILKRYRMLMDAWSRTDSDEILELYLNALTTSFDPHSDYMSSSTLEDFNIQMRLSLDGIGARLRWEDGYTIVAEILPDGAADLDGRLHVDDKIIAVAEDGEHVVDVVGMKLKDVVKKIRGRRDTPVLLRVLPVDKTESVDYRLMRAKIELKNQEAWGQTIEHGQKADGTPYRTGYISLPSFYLDILAANNADANAKRCSEDVKKILLDMQKPRKAVDAVVLDLRMNGGGALSEAIALTGLFIDQGPVVKVKGRIAREDLHEDDEPGTVYAGPLLVLVNKLSASASEIFAGAIQDYRRGLVVGDSSTHGKGTVQTVVDISGRRSGLLASREPMLGALKLTIQQFYRVNGDSTQNRGVVSDIVLPALTDHLDTEADLPQALPFEHVSSTPHSNYGLVSPEMVTRIRELSEKRRTESADFQKVIDDIARWEHIKQRKSFSLNEEQRREEKQRTDKAEEAASDPDEIPNPDRKKKNKQEFERNFYNNEVLSIVEDFLLLGKDGRVAQSGRKQ
jgi:carboxyl-terminal processing protease